ncbi:MAG: hypothetical protein IPL53_13940 [Ignavibacteria bacterium]|nr:hypothetical protein [Ignavibacteria bacterium]
MRVLPAFDTITNFLDSSFHYVSVPGVKLYDKSAFFSASVSPAPSAGSITLTFLNKTTNELLDSLNAFPDSLRLRVVTSGGVTAGSYTITVKGNGLNGTPVHTRSININVTNSPSPLPSTITFAAQGYFDEINTKLNIRDSATFYLRNINAPYTIVDSGKSVVDSISASGTVTFANAQTGTYYIVVKGPNILETWSRSGGEVYTRGTPFAYNFTNGANKAFGDNLILKRLALCIYSGEVVKNNAIDLDDIIQINNAASSFTTDLM